MEGFMNAILNSHELARWFIFNNPSLASGYLDENVKLNKLLYFTALMYYCVRKEQLIDEPFIAFPKGPVLKSVYRDYRYNNLDKMPKNDDITEADDVQKQIIYIINFIYSDRTATDLINETHEHNIWKAVSDYIPNNPIIDFSDVDESLSKYFVNLYDIYKSLDFSDLKKEKINGNVFYYSPRNLTLTDDIVSELSELPLINEPQFIENIDGELVFS